MMLAAASSNSAGKCAAYCPAAPRRATRVVTRNAESSFLVCGESVGIVVTS